MAKEIIYNFLLDMKKKQVDNFDRAALIKEYLKANNLSIRSLAATIGIGHTTLNDWLLWNKLSREKYEEYISLGYTDTDIYRFLRDNKLISKERIENTDPLLNKVDQLKRYLNRHRKKADSSHVDAVKDLINACNYYLSYAEKKR